MAFIGISILSSCSAPNQLIGMKNNINDDDVYYTKAKAGDQSDYINQDDNTAYTADDNYYYYGDYATRLNRFANNSPFDYNDDFYYSYVPYNNGFGAGLDYNLDYYGYNYGYGQPNNTNPYIYSPYDYGYSPFDLGGYDDFGYGDIYAAYLMDGEDGGDYGGGDYGGGGYGGGGYGGSSWRHHNHNNGGAVTAIGNNPNVRGARTTPSPGVTRVAAYYPGNPMVNLNRVNGGLTRNSNVINGNNNITRQTRDNTYRPAVQQNNTPAPSYSNSNAGSSSSNTSGGGGGRPVRP
jgi:hypothetical protein